ncbi:WD40 repeat domain-containing serine/threonine-protein kinase [Thermogemmatispora tikiterensis]|uniref:Protein kinase domain-containing protein n=1 Tax=Thermogemmatispora tikiterensis TaxID=1825093 RepID=A0A328VMH7_9CHLR|nr:WD40 repeat domain-containing serine/threonine-protein kinase [Thermogemmatispora tikiterensis]RAQ98459.1 hypothetical protein A4R35_23155 [Thermogemmatispora tikiterensis]
MSSTFPHERFCDHCGAANPLDAVRCWHCQTPLTAPQEEPGAVLVGRYRLLHGLGQGGMGTVFLAEDLHLGRKLSAVKRLYKRHLTDQERAVAERAFQQEAELLARLRHPGLPTILDYWSEPEASYLVMDYIEGETLEAIQQRVPQQRLPLEQVLDWGQQLCEVLIYLHEQQPPIIFRDLKPANVMRRSSDGRLLLIDFGIARHFKPGQTHDTLVFGSPGFAAPEQYGLEQTTPRSDLYSLGALLHSLLSGRDPRHQPFRFAPLRQLNPEVPEELARLIAQLVELEPKQRPPSAREVLKRLKPLIQQPGISDGEPSQAQPSGASPPKQALAPTVPAGPFVNVVGQSGQSNPAHARRLRLLQQPGISRRSLLALGLGLGGAVALPLTIVGIKILLTQLARQQTSAATASILVNPLPLLLTCRGHNDWVTALAWSPDGAMLASASSDRTVRLWDPRHGQTLRVYHGHRSSVLAISWSFDGIYIASASTDGLIHVWEAKTGLPRLSYQAHHGPVTALAWLREPKSSVLASAGADGLVHIWNGLSGQLIFTYEGHRGSVRALAWQPGNSLLASAGDDSTVQIWEAVSGNRRLLYRGHRWSVTCLAWSPDGDTIASGAADTTVQVWDPNSGQLQQTYRGHHNTVTGVSWSPQGGEIASCSYDNTVQVWYSYIEMPLERGQSYAPQAIAWSPTSTLIATGDQNALVEIWQPS